MQRLPPTPVSKSFLVCQRVFVDKHTGETMILGPMHQIYASGYPLVATLAIYCRWLSVHGVYDLDIQLQDLEGNIIWGERQQPSLECHDPLLVTLVTMQPLSIYFPRPGKYEIVILANGQEVIRDVFFALLSPQQVSEPPPNDV